MTAATDLTRGVRLARSEEVTPGRVGLYALMTTIWGSSFFFTAIALREFNPFLLVQLRMMLATAVLGVFVAATRRHLPTSRRMWAHFVVLGLFSIAFPYTLLTWAQVWVDSSTAIVLSSTTPIFVFLFATFVTRTERFSLLRLIGIVVAFAGVVLLTAGGGGSSGWFWPVVIVFTSVVYAAANIYTRTFVSSVDPLVTALLQLGFGALWLAPVTTLTGSWRVGDAGILPILAVLELGLLGSAFAYVLFFFFIKTWGSTATSINTYLQPVVGVLLGVVVLGERPTVLGSLALAVIGAGVALFGWSGVRRLRGDRR
ncbi:DMT family transporter [Microbacterium sp.]|uniref:DMT family transporter n=1 Tax=Microbacterium sp. TaxID=51671 RepID=UPI0039E21456